MDASSNQLTKDYKCGYCCQSIEDMIEPVELPCGHVNCRPCLLTDFNKLGGATCPFCQTLHQTADISSWKAVVLPKEENSKKLLANCSTLSCNKNQAVSYCIPCEEILCDTCQQKHLILGRDFHKVILVEEYLRSPSKYKKVYCRHHPTNVLEQACKECYMLICKLCEKTKGPCSAGFSNHQLNTLKRVSTEVAGFYKELIKSCEEEITRLYKLDKASWSKVEQVETDSEHWLEEVEKTYNDQVDKALDITEPDQIPFETLKQQLTEDYEQVKGQIHKYLKEINNQAETYNTTLVVKKEEFEELINKIKNLISNGHLTEIIKQRTTIRKEVNTSLYAEEFAEFELKKTAKLIIDNQAKLGVLATKIIFVPSSLTFLSSHDVEGSCALVSYYGEDKILATVEHKLLELNRNTMMSSPCTMPYENIIAAIEYQQFVYILHREENIDKIEKHLSNLEHIETLMAHEFAWKSEIPMAVSDKLLVVLSTYDDDSELLVYDVETKLKRSFPVDGCFFPYLLPDGHLLAAEENKLIKYSIEGAELRAIWTCEDLQDIGTVCCDAQGLIFASSAGYRKSCIYVISSTGEKMRELQHEEIPNACMQICVKEDEVAMPSWSDNKVVLFKLG